MTSIAVACSCRGRELVSRCAVVACSSGWREFAGLRLHPYLTVAHDLLHRVFRANDPRRGTVSPPGFRGDAKALQLGVARSGEPSRQRVAASGAQHLLRRPKRVRPVLRPDDEQVHQIDARRSKRRCIGHVRRRDADRARRKRNIALGLTLGGIVILFYLMSLVKFGH